MSSNKLIAEIDAGPLANDNTSVFWHIEQGALNNPQRLAVLCMHQPANQLSALVAPQNASQHEKTKDCLTMTYSQLHRAALTLASGLLANDVQPGSTVLTLIPNGGEYAILLYLCTLMRLTFASLDPTALDASRVEELRDLMQGINPGVVVVPDESGARAIDSLTESGGLPRPFGISLAGDHVNGWKTLLSLMTDARSSPMDEFALLEQAREDDPNRIHSILFTSGTSAGRPKGCPQRVASMTHVLHHLSWLISRKNSTRVLQQAHNSRAIAPAHTLQTWRKGGAVVMANASFAIEDTVEAILHHGVTFIVLSPAMVHALAHELLSRPESVDSVRTIHLGGDAVTKDVLMKCAALFPKAKVCISHGMTEGLGFFEWPFLDTPLSQIPFFGEICPTGAVAAGTKLRLWDADKQMVTKRGQPGELHVSCESIIRHYHGGAGSSSFYEDEKGRWFITGDISIMNDNGLVFILGRSKDVIKRAGTTIMPIALESSIEKYTGSQASVVAVSHAVLGQEPFAVLSSLNCKTEDEIKNHVRLTFGEDYALEGVLSLEQIGLNKFPVNATHKVVKFEVQAAVEKYLNRGQNLN